MHRLVHAWGSDRLSKAEQEIFAVGSLELISEAISRCGPVPRDQLRLAPHITASFSVLSSANFERTWQEKTLTQVDEMSSFLEGLGRWSDALAIETFLL